MAHTTGALHREVAILHKYQSPSVPDPLLYLHEATGTENIGRQLNYSLTPLPASHEHRCTHHLFKMDISANRNWDSIPKTQHLFSFLAAPGQLKPAISTAQKWVDCSSVASSKAKIGLSMLKCAYCPQTPQQEAARCAAKEG